MRQCRWPAFRCSQLPHMFTRTHKLWERQHVVVTLSRMKVTPRNRRLAFVFVSLHWLWQLALQTMRNARNEKQSQTKVMKKKKCIVLLSRSDSYSSCIVIAVALRLSASLCEFSVWLLTTSTTVRCLGVLLTWAQSSYLRLPTPGSQQQQRHRHRELYP